MISQSLTLFVSFLVAISISLVISEPLCINYKFKCCPDISYKVLAITAQQIDQYICEDFKEEFTVGPLANASQACKNSYVKMYCLDMITQCCDYDHSSITKPCRSACVQESQDCFHTNGNFSCPLGLWFNPPCNNGSGVSCPS